MDINIEDFKRVHFIGIGGISMSGLAHILINAGHTVTGSDLKDSHIIKKLKTEGAVINIPHEAKNVDGANLVVYTAAVKQDNPEIIRAKELAIPLIDRATLLGQIMKKFKYGVAVAGSHGKTTATSLVSILLKEMNYDPTVLIGGEVDILGGNVRVGNSDYFITEACEYTDSFLKFYPYIAVILNVDSDHLDYFKNIENIKQSFTQFANLVPDNGFVVACGDDKNTMNVLQHINRNIITFGIENRCDWNAKDISFNKKGCPSFNAFYKGKNMGRYELSIVGKHNIYNALASLAVCNLLCADMSKTSEFIKKFKGTHRRFEEKGKINGITVIDDYAHHPTEIKATLLSAKNYPHERLICVFQPHTYSRTKSLLNGFAESFDDADIIIITDIYAAREKDTGLVNSKDLSELIAKRGKNVIYIESFTDIVNYLRNTAIPGDVIMTIGAGNIYEVGDMYLNLSKAVVGA
ncbi:UDP-N-acetylmuramate--L-alanine ligase [Aceticella autotrophica]|uniref:UDP-N-acetylmuramate--L-alanine ligase n=1 Tax=Aceticella autotrophica TaxID=2755338 RepID=A0A975AVZ4_9THEO|nr:UDP-N-acetylmuramate--L-alanine ligase [Aceticella autotrophica]QSZ27464.1 UDP-N-acetylmuramate--L-alanine ligase [Aceticella autotrophica]